MSASRLGNAAQRILEDLGGELHGAYLLRPMLLCSARRRSLNLYKRSG